MRSLTRLLKPKTIAVFGGDWAREVLRQLRRFGYEGEIWPVHPERDEIEGFKTFRSPDALPSPPDAAFIGVNRHETIRLAAALARMGAGGAVCFASGFAETGDEGARLQRELVEAAGDMPLLGPNAYGFINAFDRALLWPDLHGCAPVVRGVAIIAQSSNIAINLTMGRRALPVGYVLCLGNQAAIGLAEAIRALAADERVSVIALHIEAISEAAAFAEAVHFARKNGKPVVALRAGRSDGSRKIAQSHTASLAGASAVAAAFLKRIGVAEVDTIPELIETAKLLHVLGPLDEQGLVTLSCSGGEAGLVADHAERAGVKLAEFTLARRDAIRATVNPLVAVSNPFDYHTFDWGVGDRLTRTFTQVMRSGQAATALVLDWPKAELGPAPAWDIARQAFAEAARATNAKAIVVATVPECLPEAEARALLAEGVAPMQGLAEMMTAVRAACEIGRAKFLPVIPAKAGIQSVHAGFELYDTGSPLSRGRQIAFGAAWTLDEAEGKARLAAFGVPVPEGVVCSTLAEALDAAERLAPVAMKAVGADLAHKTELGAVKLNVTAPAAAYEELAKLSAARAGGAHGDGRCRGAHRRRRARSRPRPASHRRRRRRARRIFGRSRDPHAADEPNRD